MNSGAVILCGGESRRMGFDKWNLRVGNRTILEWTIDALLNRVNHLVVSTTRQVRNRIPDFEVDFVFDENEECGPLEGIRCGLKQLANDCDIAFVIACDVPLLQPELADFLLSEISDRQAVIPVDENHLYPLLAAYRTDVHPLLENLILERSLRATGLADVLNTKLIPAGALRNFDPELYCLRNINRPEAYREFLRVVSGRQAETD